MKIGLELGGGARGGSRIVFIRPDVGQVLALFFLTFFCQSSDVDVTQPSIRV